MREWRKASDDNLRLKDLKIKELMGKHGSMEADFKKLKAENLMLRRNQKEWLGSTSKQIEKEC